jgi:hypothetical protein
MELVLIGSQLHYEPNSERWCRCFVTRSRRSPFGSTIKVLSTGGPMARLGAARHPELRPTSGLNSGGSFARSARRGWTLRSARDTPRRPMSKPAAPLFSSGQGMTMLTTSPDGGSTSKKKMSPPKRQRQRTWKQGDGTSGWRRWWSTGQRTHSQGPRLLSRQCPGCRQRSDLSHCMKRRRTPSWTARTNLSALGASALRARVRRGCRRCGWPPLHA